MARITVEDCLKRIPNLFDLVLTASKRSRRLANGAESLVEWDNDKPTVVALREIAAGHIDIDILEENEQQKALEAVFEDESRPQTPQTTYAQPVLPAYAQPEPAPVEQAAPEVPSEPEAVNPQSRIVESSEPEPVPATQELSGSESESMSEPESDEPEDNRTIPPSSTSPE